MKPAESEKNRMERDALGEKAIPSGAYYGIQTLRAWENFQITGLTVDPEMIRSVAQIKKAAAAANLEAGCLEPQKARAILTACDEILAGRFCDQFILDPIQGGAGTSFNMNANEVIANRAIEILGGQKGDYRLVNPNDHVNEGQSTNDVFPSCGRITVYRLLLRAEAELERLRDGLLEKAAAFDHVLKMGRTQLQDAVPIRLGQEFRAYARAVERDIARFQPAKKEMCCLNLGGTAIGTGINAGTAYRKRIVPLLAGETGFPLVQAEDLIDATQNADGYVLVSGALKTCAVSLSKMCNDLRLMSSGPKTGLAEISLPPRQNGSSIMPGKINPVIPEVVSQAAFHIIGSDITVTMAAEAGQLELNAFEPVIFFHLIQSAKALAHAASTLTDHCIAGITANEKRCAELVNASVGIVTALCPCLGYQKSTEIAKEALRTGMGVKELVRQKQLLSESELSVLLDPYAMTGAGEALPAGHGVSA